MEDQFQALSGLRWNGLHNIANKGVTMKVVILAGGLGTRLAEETEVKPKPLVEIGERPILWHIMKHYAKYGYKEFIIALGYKGDLIKRFFLEQATLQGNLTLEMQTGKSIMRDQLNEDWVVHLVDTGLESSTGGRIARVREFLDGETFMMTYGDGVSDVDLNALLALHRKCNRMVTLTAVRPPARFGGLIFEGDLIAQFTEKPQIGEGWINGGFMVMEPEIFNYIPSDSTNLEADVLERLAREQQLVAYQHGDFWQCMDTLRDKKLLENLWQQGNAPWKTWAS
jgi:glucose-1-phosphate cytidylyltransferase